jgi:hypothetical protein
LWGFAAGEKAAMIYELVKCLESGNALSKIFPIALFSPMISQTNTGASFEVAAQSHL